MDNLDFNNYVNQARKSGMGDDKIREGMLQAGWPGDDIEEALKKKSPISNTQITNNNKILNSKPKWRPTQAQKWIAIIGTIAILGMASAYAYVSYLAYKNYNEVARQAQQAEEAMRAIEQQRTQDPTVGWQTYTNTEYGFEFKYPRDWDVYGRESASGLYSVDIYSTADLLDTKYMHIEMTADKRTPKVLTFEEVRDEYCDNNTREDFMINNARGFTCYFNFALDSGNFRDYSYFLSSGDLSIAFNVYISPNDPLLDYKAELFKQITSTFKLIDERDTSTWKTYTNTQYGFELTLNDGWVGYKTNYDISGNLWFCLPANIDKNFDAGCGLGGYWPVFGIMRLTQEKWQDINQETYNPGYKLITSNKDYVFVYYLSQDYPDDFKKPDIEQIISTFRFTE